MESLLPLQCTIRGDVFPRSKLSTDQAMRLRSQKSKRIRKNGVRATYAATHAIFSPTSNMAEQLHHSKNEAVNIKP